MNATAIVGSGAMGTLLGACLREKGLDLMMVDSDPEVVSSISRQGLTVHGTLECTVPARACLLSELEGTFDLVILLTKQTHNAGAFPQILPHLAPDGVLLTLQNGYPEPSAAEIFGVERTMGCAVTWAATSLGPGVTLSTAQACNWHNAMGRLDGQVTEKAREVQKVMALMCPTELSSNLTGVRWSKLLINSSFSGMSAVLGCTFGEILDNEEALRCAEYIARECILTAKASGITMEPLAKDEYLDRMMYFHDESDRHATDWIYRKLFSATAEGKASMLQDLERGRKCEIRYINGAVCDAAAGAGVPVPYCGKVVELVEQMEQGRIRPGMDQLRAFPAGNL